MSTQPLQCLLTLPFLAAYSFCALLFCTLPAVQQKEKLAEASILLFGQAVAFQICMQKQTSLDAAADDASACRQERVP